MKARQVELMVNFDGGAVPCLLKEIEEEFAGTETLARRQARRCFYACFARTRASGAKVVPTTPKGGAAAFDDETLLRESRRRAEIPLRK